MMNCIGYVARAMIFALTAVASTSLLAQETSPEANAATEAASALPDANPLAGDEKAIRSGKTWFRNSCTPCHGGRGDGMGDMGTGADLRKFNLGFKRFVDTVKNGRKVQGRAQFMPSFSFFDDKTIFEIGAYVETLAIEGANWKEGVVQR